MMRSRGGATMGLLEGKKALVMGVGNKRSIAWGIATAFQREGAELAFNYATDRLKENVVELVGTLPEHERIPVMPCDVSKQQEIDALFADLGPENVRVNAISAGPLKTLAGSAVKGISAARDLMEAKAPLRRNITQEEVGNVAVFLASDWSRAVTGATIFADNGFNILGVTE